MIFLRSVQLVALAVIISVLLVTVADELVDAIHERRRQSEWKKKIGKTDKNNSN